MNNVNNSDCHKLEGYVHGNHWEVLYESIPVSEEFLQYLHYSRKNEGIYRFMVDGTDVDFVPKYMVIPIEDKYGGITWNVEQHICKGNNIVAFNSSDKATAEGVYDVLYKNYLFPKESIKKKKVKGMHL